MKYLPFLALLCCTAGCGLFGSSEPENKSSAPADPHEAEPPPPRRVLWSTTQDLWHEAPVRIELATKSPPPGKLRPAVVIRIEDGE